jgi:hypothetical protein
MRDARQLEKSEAPPKAARESARKYVPPVILWEKTFVVLLQVSQPGCHPGDPPPCP